MACSCPHVVGARDDVRYGRRPASQPPCPHSAEAGMWATGRAVPARQRGTRAEQVVVEQRMDEGNLLPANGLPDAGGDARQVGRVDEVRVGGGDGCLDGPAGVRDEIADVVAPSARTTLSPVLPVKDGRVACAVQANRKRGKHVNVVTACGEAVGKIGDILARATSCEVRALGVHEQELHGRLIDPPTRSRRTRTRSGLAQSRAPAQRMTSQFRSSRAPAPVSSPRRRRRA